MYRVTSAFAHGSDVNAHFFVNKGTDTPTLKLGPGDDQIKRVLTSAMGLMRIIIGSANEGFGLGEEAVLAKIDAELPARNGGAA